ncbi:unnamed protein product [Clonostachys byssicola]|uniref:Protein kinase domain-containing protein n=1 Tax=Clonostachys byssicola TaxID=160290 RepID=A0A9N9U3X2_9HYPO|nr:unnamed protein product [Clonostachys byssicola]
MTKNIITGLGFDHRANLIAAKRYFSNALPESIDLRTALTLETPFNEYCYGLIRKHLKVTAVKSEFLPIGAMESIFESRNVRTVVFQTFPNSCKDRIHLDISGSKKGGRTRIFATLIRMCKPEHITRFINADIYDNDLPLSQEALIRIMANKFDAPVSSDGESTKWRPFDVDNFMREQHVLLAPFLYLNCQTIQHYTFGNKIVMPFLKKKPVGRGGHGQIFKVQIHEDHHFCESHQGWEFSGPYYALKKFEDEHRQQFLDERQALLHYSGQRTGHEHLTRLLMTYQIEIGERIEYFMIFPWAECNLEQYWTTNPNNPADHEQRRWLLEQCRGLANGLRNVHKHPSLLKRASINGNGVQDRGRHGDLKPQNILCFKVQGESGISQHRLVIADFTLMRFHSVYSIDRPEEYTVGFSRTYRPPEIDLGKRARISQSYDVWTLGCVYLEFITWHLLGSDSLNKSFQFGDNPKQGFRCLREMEDFQGADHPEDKYFNIEEEGDRRKAVVKPCVAKWFTFLRGLKACTRPIYHFLNFIQHRMLVVETEHEKRQTIDIVCRELHDILKMPIVKDDPSFASSPKSPEAVKDFPPPFDSEVERELEDRANFPDTELSTRVDDESGSDDKVFSRALIGRKHEKKSDSSKSANKTSPDYLDNPGKEMPPITSSARSSPRRTREDVKDNVASSDLLNGSTQSSDFTRPITPLSDISLIHGGGASKRKRKDEDESGDSAAQSNATKKRNMGNQIKRRSLRIKQRPRDS